MRKWIAFGAVSVMALAPNVARAEQVTPLTYGFTLTKSGMNATNSAYIDAVASRMGGRVGFDEIFASTPDLRTRGLDSIGVPGALTGLRWNDTDENDPGWRPQGITGSADAYPNELAGNRKVLITSWHSEPTDPVEYARLTLHDTTNANANAKYRHVRLVRPIAGGQVQLLNSHAGGLAWIGNFLYVASSDRLLVFKISDLIRVKSGLRGEVSGDEFILPLAGTYTPDPGLRISAVSLDRSQAEAALVTSEWLPDSAKGGRIVRFPLLANGLMGLQVASRNAWSTDVTNVQGALMRDMRFAITSSYGDGNGSALFTGARKTTLRKTQWGISGAEDLFYVPSNDRLYTVTEFEGSRRVFAVDASDHGL